MLTESTKKDLHSLIGCICQKSILVAGNKKSSLKTESRKVMILPWNAASQKQTAQTPSA